MTKNPYLIGDTIFFSTENFLLSGKVEEQFIPIIKKELEIDSEIVSRECKGSLCTIYQTGRYIIIHDFQKKSSICFHGADLTKIDLEYKIIV